MNKLAAVTEMDRVMNLRHMERSTIKSYKGWLKRYVDFVRMLPREMSSEKKMEAWLSDMAPRVASSTQNQAFNAVLFFYEQVQGKKLEKVQALRARRRRTVKYCPSVKEVCQILEVVEDYGGYPTRLMVCLLYGSGLRVSEVVRLRVQDVRIDQRELIIRDSKHGKDRVVVLPNMLVDDLQVQLRDARFVFERDRLHELPVALPRGIGRKYPTAAYDWNWFYLFPRRDKRRDDSGRWVRHHCIKDMVQRAMRCATGKLELRGITPHTLRHAHATHLYEQGVGLVDIQHALGHTDIKTTMTYVHAINGRITSPLEQMDIGSGLGGAGETPAVRESQKRMVAQLVLVRASLNKK